MHIINFPLSTRAAMLNLPEGDKPCRANWAWPGSITRFSTKIYENNRKIQEISKQSL
jgi:hypothetical protein